MVYLIKNIVSTYTIIVDSLANLPVNSVYTYNILNGTYNKNGKMFAEVLHMPTSTIPELITMDKNISNTIDRIYRTNHEQILTQHKDKFLIVALLYLPDYTKEVVYSNFYINVRTDPEQYRLLKENRGFYYDISNYKTKKFDRFIEIPEAIKKIEQYMVDFLVDYKPNIVKTFSTSNEFMKYIESEDIS